MIKCENFGENYFGDPRNSFRRICFLSELPEIAAYVSAEASVSPIFWHKFCRLEPIVI